MDYHELIKFYLARIPYTMIIGMDVLRHYFPFTFDEEHFSFIPVVSKRMPPTSPLHNLPMSMKKSVFKDELHSFFSIQCLNRCDNHFLQWFATEHAKHKAKIQHMSEQLMQFSLDDPLKFWDKSKITIHLPMVPHATPTKASHSRLSLIDYEEAKVEYERVRKAHEKFEALRDEFIHRHHMDPEPHVGDKSETEGEENDNESSPRYRQLLNSVLAEMCP